MIAIPSSINNLYNLLIVGHFRSYFSFFTPGDERLYFMPTSAAIFLELLMSQEVSFIETILVLTLSNFRVTICAVNSDLNSMIL